MLIKFENLTEKEKMLKGLPYNASDKEIRELFFKCKDKIEKYNKTSYKQPKLREQIIRKLFCSAGKNIYIEPFFIVIMETTFPLGIMFILIQTVYCLIVPK